MTDPDFERGAALESQGDLSGAEDAYSLADQRGDAESAFCLGLLRRRRGDVAGAEDAYRRADQRGNPRASCNLAVLLEDRGDIAGAEAAYHRADAVDFPGGAYGLGQLLYQRGDIDGSIAANRRADELGDDEAAFNLGVLLKEKGDLEGAEGAFARADERGSGSGASARGRLLEQRGDLAAAEAAYRRAEERGDPDGPFNIGALLVDQDRLAEGCDAFRRADEMGHPNAAGALAIVEEQLAGGAPAGESDVGGATPDPALENAVKWAQYYAAVCGDVLTSTNACVEVANGALGARDMANQRPQHEISIANFTKFADEEDQAFVPLYRSFVETCATARDAATNLLACQSERDPELVLLTAAEDQAYGNAATAIHILRSDFGSTPAAFMEGLQTANAAIQADVFHWGEDGFRGYIWVPPAPELSDERTCPWCAETIKAAAIICRFCGRDVEGHH